MKFINTPINTPFYEDNIHTFLGSVNNAAPIPPLRLNSLGHPILMSTPETYFSLKMNEKHMLIQVHKS